MVTIQELSIQCGVSVSTISKALNGYSDISDKTKDLVFKTASEMGYFPNANTKTQKLKKTYNIGVIHNSYAYRDFNKDYYSHILSVFKDEAASKGYDITFVDRCIGRRSMSYLEHCQYRHFDGVCIVSTDYENEEVTRLVNSEIPVVTIDHAFDNSVSIISDSYSGMNQLTNFIIQHGHTSIALIHGVKNYVTKNRIKSFIETMKENGLIVPAHHIIECSNYNQLIAKEIGTKLLQLPDRPTCLIAPDSQSSVGLVYATKKCGLQLGKDISFAGYDGTEMNQYVGLKLTTLKQERDIIGKEAATKLIRMIEHTDMAKPDTILIKQTLIVGNTVRRIK